MGRCHSVAKSRHRGIAASRHRTPQKLKSPKYPNISFFNGYYTIILFSSHIYFIKWGVSVSVSVSELCDAPIWSQSFRFAQTDGIYSIYSIRNIRNIRNIHEREGGGGGGGGGRRIFRILKLCMKQNILVQKKKEEEKVETSTSTSIRIYRSI